LRPSAPAKAMVYAMYERRRGGGGGDNDDFSVFDD
jgi:hypothetical protein